MAEIDTNVVTEDLGSIPLRELYRSIQDQLVLTIEKSLDLGKESLAGRLDDILLRQRFWEEDIHLEKGALSDLEANDVLASSIIRLYFDDIRLLLQDISGTISESDRYVPFTASLWLHQLRVVFHLSNHRACLAAIEAYLTLTSETDKEKEQMALLYETNTKLCEQVEIFDAIAANQNVDAAGIERKATTIGQLRHQLEEEHKKIHPETEKKPQAASVLSPLKKSDVAPANFHSTWSSEKLTVSETTFFQERGNDSAATEDKASRRLASWWFPAPVPNPSTVRHTKKIEGIDPASEEPEFISRILLKHALVLNHYQTLVVQESEKGSFIITAFGIEWARAQQWRDHGLPENRTRGFWSLCESIITSKEKLLSQGVQLMKTRGLSGHGTSEWLESCIRQLSYWNDTLFDMSSPPLKQESLRRHLRISLLPVNVEDLQYLESASAFLGHSDLEQLAKAKILIEQLHSFTPEKMNRLLSLRSEDQSWHNKDELVWRRTPFSNNETTASAVYRGESVITSADYRGESVIIQWLPMKFDKFASNRNLRWKSFCFREVLNTCLVPLSNLPILGFFEENPDIGGCIYHVPPGDHSDRFPITLNELLERTGGDTVPELGKRFKLSIALVKTVFELHSMGLVHGNIRPGNILFWSTANTGTKPDFGRPHLIGFNMESLQVGRIEPGPSSEMKVPRMPELTGSWYSSTSENRTSPCSDLYKLGAVLYQIGCWDRRFTKMRTDNEGRLPTVAQVSGRLKGSVGSRYGEAVSVCLSRELGAALTSGRWSEDWRTYLYQVQIKVLDPIAMCSA